MYATRTAKEDIISYPFVAHINEQLTFNMRYRKDGLLPYHRHIAGVPYQLGSSRLEFGHFCRPQIFANLPPDSEVNPHIAKVEGRYPYFGG
jgi:hypothetical protein